MTKNITISSLLSVVVKPTRKNISEKKREILTKTPTLIFCLYKRVKISELNRDNIKPTFASFILCKKKFKLPKRAPAKKLVTSKIDKIFVSSVWAFEKNEYSFFST